MKAVIAIDLDQTLIYSDRSAQLAPGGSGAGTLWVEDYLDAPLSLMTVTAHQLLDELSRRHHVVPVTARTPEQYARVRLPGEINYAVCANGGVLLRDGERDPVWDEHIASLLRPAASAADVAAQVRGVENCPWVRTVRQVEDLFVYLVAHQVDQIPPEWLSGLISWTAQFGWSVSVQGRKVYAVPDALSKGAAALHVAALLDGPLLAAGDSLLDVSMLDCAAFAIRPAHGELHAVDHRPPGLRITSGSGAAAADEMLHVLAEAADGLVAVPPAATTVPVG